MKKDVKMDEWRIKCLKVIRNIVKKNWILNQEWIDVDIEFLRLWISIIKHEWFCDHLSDSFETNTFFNLTSWKKNKNFWILS